MTHYKAFIFDLNGTMINDMEYHITAWHKILNDHGANISLEKMKQECYGKNHELLERILPGRFTMDEKNTLSLNKEQAYQQGFKPHLKLFDGLDEFLKSSYSKGIKMAIGSAAIMFNVDFVIDGLNIRQYFEALVSADQVTTSKPDPETFLLAARLLNIPPQECLVFEDHPNGVLAASNAGMQSVVITSMHQPHEFEGLNNIIAFVNDYTELPISLK